MKIFIALADFSDGQEWLGSDQGSQIWKLLINLTCSSSNQIDTVIQRSEELCFN
jgi:hypothetical protein